MTNEEITKEIIVTMIQMGKILPASSGNAEICNKSYNEELCKAYIAVYKTVNNAPTLICQDR